MTRKTGTLTLKRPHRESMLAINRRASERARKRRLEASKRVVGELMAKHPGTFDPRRPKPLKIGIRHEVMAACAGSRSVREAALYWWVRRRQYLEALARPGSQRHDLDGTPLEPVSDEHRAEAAERLAAHHKAPDPAP